MVTTKAPVAACCGVGLRVQRGDGGGVGYFVGYLVGGGVGNGVRFLTFGAQKVTPASVWHSSGNGAGVGSADGTEICSGTGEGTGTGYVRVKKSVSRVVTVPRFDGGSCGNTPKSCTKAKAAHGIIFAVSARGIYSAAVQL